MLRRWTFVLAIIFVIVLIGNTGLRTASPKLSLRLDGLFQAITPIQKAWVAGSSNFEFTLSLSAMTASIVNTADCGSAANSASGIISKINCYLKAMGADQPGTYTGQIGAVQIRVAVTKGPFTYSVNGQPYDFLIQAYRDDGGGSETKFMKYFADSHGKRGVIEIYTYIPLGQTDMEAVKVEWDSSVSPKYLSYHLMILTSGATDWSTMATGDYASWFEAYIDGNVAEISGAWHCYQCDGGSDIKEYFQAYRSETHELTGGTSCDPANTCVTPKSYECREIAGNPPATETDGVSYSDANVGSCAGFSSGGYALTPAQPTQANLDLFGDMGSIWTLNQ